MMLRKCIAAPMAETPAYSTGLSELEARLLAMRALAPDLGRAFTDALSVATGALPTLQPACPLRQAGEALIASIHANPGKSNELPYHNQYHFAEAVLAMGTLCAAARELGLISPVEAALGVVAMVGHDIGHDGSSASGGALEALAAAETVRISRSAGVPAEQLEWLAYIIAGTDPGAVAGNEDRSARILPPGRFGASADALRSLANEADVMASLLPHLGLRLGDALAAERRLAGGADRIATFGGRLAFLRLYAWFSPAATRMRTSGHGPGADRAPRGRCRQTGSGNNAG